jgi:hypothetical protein
VDHTLTRVAFRKRKRQCRRQNTAKISSDARVHLQLSRLYFRMGDETRARQEADLSLELRSRKPASDELPTALRSGH